MYGKQKKYNGIPLKTVGWLSSIFAIVVSTLLIVSLFLITNRYNEVRDSTVQYMDWKTITLDVQHASDYLTDQVRSYVVTGKEKHLDNYFEEAKVTKRREKALLEIESYLGNTQVFLNLKAACDESNSLMIPEYYAMRLTLETQDYYDLDKFPEEIQNVVLTEADEALDKEGKKDRAINIVYGEAYNAQKDIISNHVDKAVHDLDKLMEDNVLNTTEKLRTILVFQQVLIILNVIYVAGLIVMMFVFVIKPVKYAVNKIVEEESVKEMGVREFQYLATVYNKMLEQNKNNNQILHFQAEHDKLTGLYNRTGYDAIYRNIHLDKAFYILLDVDRFKSINDKYGHETGDNALIKVAKTLTNHISGDNIYIFRIGGDEFSIIIENGTEELLKNLIIKFNLINKELSVSKNNVPSISLSIGIAIGGEDDTTDSLFKKADIALYETKRNGRGNITVYRKQK